jgi:D-amino-acid dehydrogenase
MIASGLLLPDRPTQDWMGCRPTLPDYLPVIGASRRHHGLLFAFGHQHLGLTLSGTTARMIRDLVTAGTPPPAALAIERFG